MARLEDEGFISQPHTSAGRVPSDKGYRYYVETLMAEEQLGRDEREMIRHQFHQAEHDLEEWFQLAAAVLAHSVRNFAVVTSPRSKEARLRHVQLVSLHELSALLVVVLQEARVRQQVLNFQRPVDQEALNSIASRLNAAYGGLTPSEMRRLPPPASDLDEAVVGVPPSSSTRRLTPWVMFSATVCARCFRSQSSPARNAFSTLWTCSSSARWRMPYRHA